MPPIWLSPVDASDPAAGIHCGRVPAGAGVVARNALKLLEKFRP